MGLILLIMFNNKIAKMHWEVTMSQILCRAFKMHHLIGPSPPLWKVEVINVPLCRGTRELREAEKPAWVHTIWKWDSNSVQQMPRLLLFSVSSVHAEWLAELVTKTCKALWRISSQAPSPHTKNFLRWIRKAQLWGSTSLPSACKITHFLFVFPTQMLLFW